MLAWLPFAIGSLVAFVISDVITKFGAVKISPFLATIAEAMGTFFVAVIVFLIARTYDRHIGELRIDGILWAMLAGACIAFAVLGLYKIFSMHAPISIAMPFIRVGAMIVSALIGVLLFREPLTLRLVIGIAVASIGVYFIATSK